MSNDNLRGDKPHDDESTDDEEPDCSECSPSLNCFEHYEITESDGDTDAENAVADGGLTRIPHIPNLGDTYVIDGSAYEVATFADGGSTVVFEPMTQSTSEIIMPLNTVRDSDAARYVE